MDPISVTITTPKQSTTIAIGDDGAHKVSTGADVLTFSPDGHSRHSQAQEDADNAEVARVAGLIAADPSCVQSITPEAWIAALEAEDARWRAASVANPADQPSYPVGPFGVKYVDQAVHDAGPSSPFAGGASGWPMESPALSILNWRGATPSLANAMADWVKPHMAALNLQTKPGWQSGWGPVA